MPTKELPLGVLGREVAGRLLVLRSTSSRRLAARQDLGVGESKRSTPLACVDEQCQVQRKPRLAGVEVPNLRWIRVAKHALGRVMDRENHRRASRTLCRPRSVGVEQSFKADTVVAEQAVGALELGVGDQCVR